MQLILKFCTLAVASAAVIAAPTAAAVATAGNLRKPEKDVAPHNGKGWVHNSTKALAMELPVDEVHRIHLVSETRRHQVKGCGPNRIEVSKGVYKAIMSQLLSSHLDYSCSCLEASFTESLYQPDGTMEVGGGGFEKNYKVPAGQEKAKLCEAMEYLSMFVSDMKCMEGQSLIHNDNWQETLCR